MRVSSHPRRLIAALALGLVVLAVDGLGRRRPQTIAMDAARLARWRTLERRRQAVQREYAVDPRA